MKRTLLAIMIGAISTGLAGGALAQDNAEEDNGLNGDAAVGEEQAPMEAEGNQDDAELMDDSQDMETMDDSQDMETDEAAPATDAGSGGMAMGNQLDDSLRDMQVSEIEGKTVVNLEDEEIGDVQNVVKENDTGDLYVVVTVGGLWGMGGSDITLPLSDMQLQDDQLVIQQAYGEDELEESSEEYDEERYTELDDDEMTLGDAWGQ
ncbi:PRC-barrel domain-containing protein [Billgrantia sp. C5P2]|uniref:PRC-barrel domain-containing protein n=1 Tax=Billgrantia sp. C5P2 TaxID=3436239 RepID=UPI003DA32CC3